MDNDHGPESLNAPAGNHPSLTHPRNAQYERGREKQIPVCSLRALTYLQVEDLPRQWMGWAA
jgi:hypothetical protein